MSLYVLSDPHLSFSTNKPMDIFSRCWENHAEKLAENWRAVVKREDTVVIPGDLSWGKDLESAYLDLKYIDSLPGKKLIGKGNHDYWWTTLSKMKRFCGEKGLSTIDFLYNNAHLCEDLVVCGTRGWMYEFGVKTEDERIIRREAERLKLSLSEGEKILRQSGAREIVVFLHYPPVFGDFLNLDLLDVLYSYGIKRVYYGHLHGVKKEHLDHEYIGISLSLVSCDYVDFTPVLVN